MWRIWLMVDPRRALIATALFVITVVSANHFIQLSTPRYGSWLHDDSAVSSAAVIREEDDVLVARSQ